VTRPVLSTPFPPALAHASPPVWRADPNRCERGYTGNTIGQANAVSDKLLDLRGCSFDNKSLVGRTLSGALMVGTSFKGADLTEVIMSKAYAVEANFDGATFKNAVLDRVIFNNASLKNASFTNSVITGAEFEGADLTGAKFEDTLVRPFHFAHAPDGTSSRWGDSQRRRVLNSHTCRGTSTGRPRGPEAHLRQPHPGGGAAHAAGLPIDGVREHTLQLLIDGDYGERRPTRAVTHTGCHV
jgi:hypothetical protein